MSWILPSRTKTAQRTGIVSVLDIGSSKMCCIIARLKPCKEHDVLRGRTHDIRILGVGHHKSDGVKSGVISDLARAEQAIRMTVDGAERMAGLTVDSLIVNLSAGRLKSRTFQATINLNGQEINANDISRVLGEGAKQAKGVERQPLHSLPVSYVLDGERNIVDPIGMLGDELGVNLHVMTSDSAPMRNLELCINRAHLSVERMVATPYASGLAALVQDETEMGAACIDMGGGTTTISVFAHGRFVYGSSLPIGGNHITLDLARGLSMALDEAERLKVMHGSALPSASDERDVVNIPPIGDDHNEVARQLPRSVVTRIIRARCEEILEMVRDHLNSSGFGSVVGKRTVLTGGSSQLSGLPEMARRVLGRNVRVGRPLGFSGLPEAAKGPAFSTAAGLLIYPQVGELETYSSRGGIGTAMTGTGGRIQRVSQWLLDGF